MSYKRNDVVKIKVTYENGRVLSATTLDKNVKSQISNIIKFKDINNAVCIDVYRGKKLLWHKNFGTYGL